ncbi:MAG: hypothetical protein HQ536_02770 [Parcubacteria group bacterium]|nr:hypothetical protein [Parcubacteria group bacterium]
MTKEQLMSARIAELQRNTQATNSLCIRDLKKDDVLEIITKSQHVYRFKINSFVDDRVGGTLRSSNPEFSGPIFTYFDGSILHYKNKDGKEAQKELFGESIKLGARCWFGCLQLSDAKLVRVNGVQILPVDPLH